MLLALARPAHAGESVYFEHEDARYLRQHQRRGGALFVPEAARGESGLPLVVFLHGTNPRGALHLWFGGMGKDLRPVVERVAGREDVRPFVFAAPSQTVGANFGHSLWSSFDLPRFVSDVRAALGERASVDPEAVYLFGHSGAGCNPTGGLAADFTGERAIAPLAVVSIDPCLDEEMGRAFAERAPALPLWVLWQSQVWTRDVDAWSSALLGKGNLDYRITHLSISATNPHDGIVYVAFERAIAELLKAEPKERSTAPDAS